MSSAPSGYSAPKQDWAVDDGIADTDLNLIGDNIDAIENGDRTLAQAEPAGNVAALRELLDNFAYQIKQLSYLTNWYDEIGQIFYVCGSLGGSGISHTASDGFYDVAQLQVYMVAGQSLYLENAKWGIVYTPDSGSAATVELRFAYSTTYWDSGAFTGDDSPNQRMLTASTTGNKTITLQIHIDDADSNGTIDRKSAWSLRLRVISNFVSHSASTSPSRSASLSASASASPS